MSMSGASFGQGGQGGGLPGLAGIFGGLFGDSGAPYSRAMDQYQQYGQRAENVQNPFLQAGTGAIDDYQKWLQSMHNPSGFLNNLMGQYQESPWAKNLQQQGMRANTNAASASGLIGSTPYQQQAQQNAYNISSQDMGNWLQNALGINTQYGAGQQNLMNQGFNSANSLTNLFGNLGEQMGNAKYGQKAAQNNDFMNLLTGLFIA
jgi:hypothetical protein